MSEPIKVGDLVVVVRGCCDKYRRYLGHIFTATDVVDYAPRLPACKYCGEQHGSLCIESDKHRFTREFVKRIPPLEELDDVKREEEITA